MGAKRSPAYQTLYFRRKEDLEDLRARAEALGVSLSEYLIRAGKGDLAPAEVSEKSRALAEEAKYWRERFEQMAALAQDTQAEVLQLRAEIRARLAGVHGEGAAGPDATASALAPRLIVVFTSLRSADGRYRVWTEAELLDEMGLARDVAGGEHLRTALATLYRTNLIEPQRNGWRYRD